MSFNSSTNSKYIVTRKRHLDRYCWGFRANEHDSPIDVRKFLKLDETINSAPCPVCHGEGTSEMYQCQAIKSDNKRCTNESLNKILGNDETVYYLCGKHSQSLITRFNNQPESSK
jgi:RecJ-like exonuclease